jgi:hypothetical protein
VLRKAVLLAGLALAGCNRNPEAPEVQATDVPQAVATSGYNRAAVESQFGTPVKERVATLGLLNKRNNETTDIQLKSGESRRIGNVVVKLATCERTLPWERPPEVGAFVQVFIEERAHVSEPLAWHKVFSGWLFRNSPALNVVQHPVYDVWVKDCAMSFPGEEESPADFARASKPAKAAGSASGGAGSATAGASPSPAPSASAVPAGPE